MMPSTADVDRFKRSLAQWVPSLRERQFLANELLRSVAVASTVGEDIFGVTLLDDGFRLNVGQVEVLVLKGNTARLNLLCDAADLQGHAGLVSDVNYKSIPGPTCAFAGTIKELIEAMPDIRPYHLGFVSRATLSPNGNPRTSTSFLDSNQPAILRHARQLVGMTSLPAFVEGRAYVRRTDIHDYYGGSRRGGIAYSAVVPAVFIFTGDEGAAFGYHDEWDHARQVFTYTGAGQSGHMVFDAANRSIRDHVQDGRTLHLFSKLPDSGLYRYDGEMQCAGHDVVSGNDGKENERQIIQFRLVKITALHDDDAKTDPMGFGSDDDLAALREKAYSAVRKDKPQKPKSAVRSIYERSEDVRRYVLARANGRCEGCGAAAPFNRSDGTPYLENHHTDRVSDGGLDCPTRVAGICPTCHRHIHHGITGKDLNNALRQKIAALEDPLKTGSP